ncbi:LysR family transcriptional regulator [Rathayibacter tritici]|uniref:HTH lysR-type domain-containing protein n=1 Tax=Rathayibacter tritici TaxID=33888 RepID=A0A169BVP0_9MICO|nr:LysR family transcriptional regulator [Rathayibacter tritici]AND15935.1 hypothetical protein A6122_0782 [Rathayibacter tritici]PPI41063.1 LysR family transcriptional regulator [Rathayibacter tritici]
MKISQLRHFVAVTEGLHFVRAAERLEISRQKLDSSVAAVELDLGKPLFEPGAAATALTAAGRQRLDRRGPAESLQVPPVPLM